MALTALDNAKKAIRANTSYFITLLWSIFEHYKQKDLSKYVPEGVEGLVKYKGSVDQIIFQLIGGLKSSMGYLGAKTIDDLQRKGEFVKISKAGFYESMVHNVDQVIK